MGQIMLNGNAYAGGEAGGCGYFVDTQNVIKAQTSYSTATGLNYTATQDCAVFFSASMNADAVARILVDGVQLCAFTSSASFTYQNTIFLRRGQTITSNHSENPTAGHYTVFGVFSGSNSIAQTRYSTSDKAVGVWIDGSIVYEKVVDLGTLPNATTKNIAHGISNLGILVSADFSAYDSQGYRFTFPYTVVDRDYFGYQVSVSLDATNIIIVTDADRSAYSGYAILRYTKAST